MLLGDEAQHRHVRDEVRVAEVASPVGEGSTQALGQVVNVGRGAEAHAGQVVLLEDVQHLEENDTAGARRGRGK